VCSSRSESRVLCMIKVGQVYRIPWRCDMLARVYSIMGTWVALKWCDPAWDKTEDDLRYTLAEFLNEDPKPILMEGTL
jgi:hypothetical protein